MAEIKIADGGSLKRFRKWIQSKYYTKDDTFTKAEVNTKIDSIAFKQASSTEAGIAKLYSALGQNTDGAPTNKAVQDAVSAILDTIYPVGSIYMSVNSTDPSSFLGGSWAPLKDRFLLAAGDKYAGGSTGGEASHTLTISEMPSHNHTFKSDSGEVRGDYMGGMGNSLDRTYETSYTGGSQAHNNMPPYLTVYVWKRIN